MFGKKSRGVSRTMSVKGKKRTLDTSFNIQVPPSQRLKMSMGREMSYSGPHMKMNRKTSMKMY